jgi:hypothetical protein
MLLACEQRRLVVSIGKSGDRCSRPEYAQDVLCWRERERNMSTGKRDPWVDVRTYHGLPADQVLSALQKEIR